MPYVFRKGDKGPRFGYFYTIDLLSRAPGRSNCQKNLTKLEQIVESRFFQASKSRHYKCIFSGVRKSSAEV